MILVCGGAGYIGSHMVYELIEKGEEVVIIDHLKMGHIEAVHPDAKFYEGDIRDKNFLDKVFQENEIEGVIHFAAFSIVPESITNPMKYYDNNLNGTMVLLEKMIQYNVKKIVFSSTAAVYGEPEKTPILEEDKTNPTNTYGETKLAMEKMFKWADKAHGIKYISLRYFNVAGAHINGKIGESHSPETHLIPLILQVPKGTREKIYIFGDNYETKDGTCIRDYIHVMDLAKAHKLALDKLRQNSDSKIYNLGSGSGFSVKEMIEVARKITGHEIPAEIAERRAGDPAVLIASSEKAKNELGWKPEYTNVETIIKTAWNWHQNQKF